MAKLWGISLNKGDLLNVATQDNSRDNCRKTVYKREDCSSQKNLLLVEREMTCNKRVED